jgi:hypothetical protein
VVIEVITENIVKEKLEDTLEKEQKYSISKGDVFKPMKETVC